MIMNLNTYSPDRIKKHVHNSLAREPCMFERSKTGYPTQIFYEYVTGGTILAVFVPNAGALGLSAKLAHYCTEIHRRKRRKHGGRTGRGSNDRRLVCGSVESSPRAGHTGWRMTALFSQAALSSPRSSLASPPRHAPPPMRPLRRGATPPRGKRRRPPG